MDTVFLKKIWEDEDFFKLGISATAKTISAYTESYATEESINNLVNGIMLFAENINSQYLWENGKRGNNTTPFISLNFQYANKAGHIRIEVFMEIDDGASFDKHNCCFYVHTDRASLDRFVNRLQYLYRSAVGGVAVLGNDSF